MDWSAIGLSVRLASATTLILLLVGLPLASWLALSLSHRPFSPLRIKHGKSVVTNSEKFRKSS